MNILEVGQDLYPESTGGTQILMWETARRLAARGQNVTVLGGTRDPAAPRREVRDGVQILRYLAPNNPIGHYLSRIVRLNGLFLKTAAAQNIDVVQVHDSEALFFSSFHPAFRRVTTVYSCHGIEAAEIQQNYRERIRVSKPAKALALRFACPFYYHRWRASQRRLLSAADGVLVLSEYMKGKLLDAYGVACQSKIAVIPGGIDTERFCPADRESARRELHIPTGRTVVFSARRFVPNTGLQNLLAALRMVLDRDPELRVLLLLAGRGPYEGALHQKIADLRLEQSARIVGYLEHADLVRYYQAADLFVVPTVAIEGFGLGTVEALACGTPALGTPVGGTVEILGRLDRRLLSADTSPGALAECLRTYLIAPCQFPSGGQCRAYAMETYGWEKVISQTESYFLGLCARNARPARC